MAIRAYPEGYPPNKDVLLLRPPTVATALLLLAGIPGPASALQDQESPPLPEGIPFVPDAQVLLAPGEVSGDFEDVLLRAGDVILVQGPRHQITELKRSGNMLVLDGTMDLPHTSRAPLALAIMATVVTLAGVGIVPIFTGSILGATAMIMSRCA